MPFGFTPIHKDYLDFLLKVGVLLGVHRLFPKMIPPIQKGLAMGRLTAQEIRNLTPDPKSKKVFDGEGLYLLLKKSGKYWRTCLGVVFKAAMVRQSQNKTERPS